MNDDDHGVGWVGWDIVATGDTSKFSSFNLLAINRIITVLNLYRRTRDSIQICSLTCITCIMTKGLLVQNFIPSCP